ncbi:MAG: hypothetical protein LIO46_01460 [Clostridiales bacterium]|nr:hypothetical protein [Clostridiales bacterium]
MRFRTWIGNDAIRRRIASLVDAGRFPHAFLLEGEPGLGKQTLARDIAAALLCQGEGERPGGAGPAFKQTGAGTQQYVFDLHMPMTTDTFQIDVGRQVRRDAYIAPSEAAYKIYLLGNIQSMSQPAQNAFLKLLEEPPAYAVFLLTADSASNLLETIRSRVFLLRLEPPSRAYAAAFLHLQFPEVPHEQADQALLAWNGNLGRAAEALAQGNLADYVDKADEVCALLAEQDAYPLIRALSRLERDKTQLSAVLHLVSDQMGRALLLKLAGNAGTPQADGRCRQMARRFTAKQLVQMRQAVQDAAGQLERNANTALLLSRLGLALRAAAGR